MPTRSCTFTVTVTDDNGPQQANDDTDITSSTLTTDVQEVKIGTFLSETYRIVASGTNGDATAVVDALNPDKRTSLKDQIDGEPNYTAWIAGNSILITSARAFTLQVTSELGHRHAFSGYGDIDRGVRKETGRPR